MTKKKTNHHLQFSFYLNIYPIDIHVCYSDNPNKVDKYFKLKTGEQKLERFGNLECSARTSRYNYHILIEIKSDSGRFPNQLAGVIAHEAVHATWMIEKAIGDIFDSNIQEPQCYLVQYITQMITQKIWHYIKKKKELYKELKS